MKKTCYLFVFDGFADWESSYAAVGISLSSRYQLKTIAIERTMKVSMGGLTVFPDFDFIPAVDLDDINPENTGMLILPGGKAWEERMNNAIEPLVRHCFENGIPVAAICGATLFLADHGWLDGTEHTSNHLGYLQALSPTYRGEDFYDDKLSVNSRYLVTANGTAAIEFAADIFEVLEIDDDEEVKSWFHYFERVTA